MPAPSVKTRARNLVASVQNCRNIRPKRHCIRSKPVRQLSRRISHAQHAPPAQGTLTTKTAHRMGRCHQNGLEGLQIRHIANIQNLHNRSNNGGKDPSAAHPSFPSSMSSAVAYEKWTAAPIRSRVRLAFLVGSLLALCVLLYQVDDDDF